MVEGEQHVVDRRAVGHDDVSLDGRAAGRRLPTKPAVLSTLRAAELGRAGRRRPTVPAGGTARFGGRTAIMYIKGRAPDRISARIRPSGLLKWPNSLYRPALPERSRARPSRAFPDRPVGA